MALTDEATARIKSMITSGELGPGDRLPKESDLAERLGLSRNSLREAVRALALIHVLDVRQGDGVTSLEPQLLLESMTFVLDFHRDDSVLHFLEVRQILEPAATELAARRMSGAAIERLGRILADLPADPSIDELVANDLRFHREIAHGAGNPALASLLESLSAPTVRARVWRGLTQEGAVARTREQHTAIFQAVRGRQAEAARAWATVHIAGVEGWLREALTGPAPDQLG